jgi:putative transposase
MQLVEQHVISKNDPRYQVIDEAAFKSKNLYNAALYEMRQSFIFQKQYLTYNQMDKLMQQHEAYRALPAKVAQWVLKGLHQNWVSFFEQCKEYKQDPSKFTGRPKLPKYKHKTNGRNVLVYTDQTMSKPALRHGLIKLSQLPITIQTKQASTTIHQVRIVPRSGYYVVEVVYEKAIQPAEVNPAYYAGIDIGINNLATLTANKPGFTPIVINGRPVKSVNQYYNKRRAELQSKLGHPGTTKRMERLTNTRNRRIDHYMYTASRRIINVLVQEGIGTLVIGKNPLWKQDVNLGKRTNQNFVQIPHARFIEMLTYKAELVGIRVIITEESYTSQASFLDGDDMPVYDPKDKQEHTFSGKRVKRGLYRSANGQAINADYNGSYNIIRKVAPDAFTAEGVEDGKAVLASLVVHPVRIVIPLTKPKNIRLPAQTSGQVNARLR